MQFFFKHYMLQCTELAREYDFPQNQMKDTANYYYTQTAHFDNEKTNVYITPKCNEHIYI